MGKAIILVMILLSFMVTIAGLWTINFLFTWMGVLGLISSIILARNESK
jgi:hypothetical protein